MVKTGRSQRSGECSIHSSFTNVIPSLCELDAPLGIRGKAPLSTQKQRINMSLVPVPTWLCLMGSWDKAQVCWKHLPYRAGGAKVAYRPHKAKTRFESYVRNHTPKTNKTFSGADTRTQFAKRIGVHRGFIHHGCLVRHQVLAPYAKVA